MPTFSVGHSVTTSSLTVCILVLSGILSGPVDGWMDGGRVSEWWSGGGGIVCCEKKRIWGCSCIVAFVVLNGAPGDARGDTGRGLELDTPRVIWAITPGEAGAIGTHAASDRRRGAPLSSGHRTPPGQHCGAQRRGTLLISNALGGEDAHLCPRPRAS